jgi:hypothetical protein
MTLSRNSAKKRLSPLRSPSTRSMSSPGEWVSWKPGSSARQWSMRSARSSLVASQPTTSLSQAVATRKACCRTTAPTYTTARVPIGPVPGVVARSRNRRMTCGVAICSPIVANSAPARTATSRPWGRR